MNIDKNETQILNNGDCKCAESQSILDYLKKKKEPCYKMVDLKEKMVTRVHQNHNL